MLLPGVVGSKAVPLSMRKGGLVGVVEGLGFKKGYALMLGNDFPACKQRFRHRGLRFVGDCKASGGKNSFCGPSEYNT